MSTPLSSDGLRGILLDIEGTTTPIAFVHDVLFSYARTHVRDYLAKHFDDEAVQADIRLLRDEAVKEGFPSDDMDEIINYINHLIDLDRKSTGLKSLQGKIWHKGYADGTLRAQVFPDVAPALARWRAAGLNVSIFSSGSVLAQQLLFAHTEAGDLTPFINHYFDTSVGKKSDAESYRRIAEAMKLQPNEILFISDVVAELAAARQAGLKTAISIRPGNQPQDTREQYPVVHSFHDVT
ncbi:MAG TPA: acireductone synthase [Pyrinomonadaceae bacterium]|nr:acireductone synthase [Pyrinomonadaceae bacterium]